jgi:ribosome biogenesis GTPase / thiamine phosphate phosphatase
MNLIDLGWNPFFREHFESYSGRALTPARVVQEHKHQYAVWSEAMEARAEVSGRFRHDARGRGDFPAVGDWVAVDLRHDEGRATIHGVLPRKSAFVRKVAGATTEQQVVAANVDTVFLVSGLDGDFNTSRIERFLTMAWESGASPVVVLNKADLCSCVDERIRQTESVAYGVPIHAVSAVANGGVEAVEKYLEPGRTVALLGMSGVGKSSLINRLLGEEHFAVQKVREDDSRGRHTTSHRELVVAQGGGAVIDTPGMRELQLWSEGDGIERAFEDVEEITAQCRFRNCTHGGEPGCGLRAALEDGTLEQSRYRSYLKLGREREYAEAKQAQNTRLLERNRWKKIAQDARKISKSGKNAR